ncbi:MAG: hypothetical protein ABWZ99_02200 [Ilumatobacteraceae bacterium]
MKTRTLLLLAVGTALAILLAGGVLLFQLSNEQNAVDTVQLGTEVTVGDVSITVLGTAGDAGTGRVLGVDVTVGGVDDLDGLDSFRLVTGDRSLSPIDAPADGRCTAITAEATTCRLDFDVSGSETSSRVLVMRRGDEQANWRLPA